MIYPTTEDILDAYWRTLLGDFEPKEEKRIKPEDFSRYREQFLVWSSRKPLEGDAASSEIGKLMAGSPFENLNSRVFGFTTARTENGHLALLPVLSVSSKYSLFLPKIQLLKRVAKVESALDRSMYST